MSVQLKKKKTFPEDLDYLQRWKIPATIKYSSTIAFNTMTNQDGSLHETEDARR